MSEKFGSGGNLIGIVLIHFSIFAFTEKEFARNLEVNCIFDH